MEFTAPQYDRPIVDLAGRARIGDRSALHQLRSLSLNADDVVSNWRSSHHYPLNTFQMTLRRKAASVDPNSIVAQRIKRLVSIDAKLRRFRDLTLSEVQDIAGCRAILESVPMVTTLVDTYRGKYGAHQLDSQNDYISSPKRSGYRGHHLIFRYANREYNEYSDLKVEIQFRTHLQHCWATAVETVDIFRNEGLKSSRGTPDWTRFFALMGSAIAIRENCKRVPGTPKDVLELVEELQLVEAKLRVRERLKAFGETLRVIEDPSVKKSSIKWILLELRQPSKHGEPTLQLYGFRARDLKAASARLGQLELFRERGSDAVLVSVSDATTLHRAFPNYYYDTVAFLEAYEEAVS